VRRSETHCPADKIPSSYDRKACQLGWGSKDDLPESLVRVLDAVAVVRNMKSIFMRPLWLGEPVTSAIFIVSSSQIRSLDSFPSSCNLQGDACAPPCFFRVSEAELKRDLSRRANAARTGFQYQQA